MLYEVITEHLSDEMLGLWRERFNQDIFEAIGMSECSYYISHSNVITSYSIHYTKLYELSKVSAT